MRELSEEDANFFGLNDFGLSTEIPGTPTPGGLPADIEPTTAQHPIDPRLVFSQDILDQLDSLIKRASNPKAKQFLLENAWACMHCEKRTVNGLSGHRLQIRKTCRKCAQPKTVEVPVIEELRIFELTNKLLS